METRIKPELEIKRKVCNSCGEKKFELAPEIQVLKKYICLNCMT